MRGKEIHKKYGEVCRELIKQIKCNQLESGKFHSQQHVPANFMKACEQIGIIKRLKGKCVVLKENFNTNLIGKLISIKISEIEKNRKKIFNATNNNFNYNHGSD